MPSTLHTLQSPMTTALSPLQAPSKPSGAATITARSDCFIGDNARFDEFIIYLAANGINGYHLIYNTIDKNLEYIKNGERQPWDEIVWQNICNAVLAIFDPVVNGKTQYTTISQGKAKSVAKSILSRYQSGKLNLLVDNTEYFDEKTKDAAHTLNEKIDEFGADRGIDPRMYPWTGAAIHKILGMKGSVKSAKILRCAGWRSIKQDIMFWTTSKCTLSEAKYKDYMVRIQKTNDLFTYEMKLPDDPTPRAPLNKSPRGSDELWEAL